MQKHETASTHETDIPSNLTPVEAEGMIRIPIMKRIFEMDGELYYELRGDSTPRKLSEYRLKDHN